MPKIHLPGALIFYVTILEKSAAELVLLSSESVNIKFKLGGAALSSPSAQKADSTSTADTAHIKFSTPPKSFQLKAEGPAAQFSKLQSKIIKSLNLANTSLQLGDGLNDSLLKNNLIIQIPDSGPKEEELVVVPVTLSNASLVFNYENSPIYVQKKDSSETEKNCLCLL